MDFRLKGFVLGQAIAETLISLPILGILLVGTLMTGQFFYQAYISSSAVEESMSDRVAFANDENGVTQAEVQALVAAYNDGSIAIGNGIDSVTLNNTNNVFASISAQSTFAGPSGNLGYITFDYGNMVINAVQMIESQLLAANTAARVPANFEAAVINLPDPDDYGIQTRPGGGTNATFLTAPPPHDYQPTGATFTINESNALAGNVFALTEFASPDPLVAPTYGVIPAGLNNLGDMYIDDAEMARWMLFDNTACDAPESLLLWTTNCAGDPNCINASLTSCRAYYVHQYASDYLGAINAAYTPLWKGETNIDFPESASYAY